MKTLLLNSTYEPIEFITERKAYKHLIKQKVEVVSSWKEECIWGRGRMDVPSILRLKYFVRWRPSKARYHRELMFSRDKYTCQYCGNKFPINELTVDHIFPESKGGKTNWKNCTTSCRSCNNKKADKTLEEAEMELLNDPIIPGSKLDAQYWQISKKHPDWSMYLV